MSVWLVGSWRETLRAAFHVLALPVIVIPLCGNALAQTDLGILQRLYQDLQASSPDVRLKALRVLQSNEGYLKNSETVDRLIALLDSETRQIRNKSYPQGHWLEGWGEEMYSPLLGTTWNLWKDKLTRQAFRVFGEAVYNSHSPFAKELGARAGRFVEELLTLSTNKDSFVRENAAALVVYALAADDRKSLPVTPLERAALVGSLAKSAQDVDYGVRLSIVVALKSAGGPWAIPILDQMRERETGKGASSLRERANLAAEAIRSRAAQSGSAPE